MTVLPRAAATEFAETLVARDLTRARALLHDDVDFRAMTPNKFWEAGGPADVEVILRGWFADPDEEIHVIEPTEPVLVEDTLRVGWRVRGTDEDGAFVYEQQAYVREHDGRIAWMRLFCSGYRRPSGD
jgi:ketosteroid isomerase-like protein